MEAMEKKMAEYDLYREQLQDGYDTMRRTVVSCGARIAELEAEVGRLQRNWVIIGRMVKQIAGSRMVEQIAGSHPSGHPVWWAMNEVRAEMDRLDIERPDGAGEGGAIH
jgi:hypothetical protein